MSMAVDNNYRYEFRQKQPLDGTILENLKAMFPGGLVLGMAQAYFLRDIDCYYYTMEKQTERTFLSEDSTGAILTQPVKHHFVLKAKEPYAIEKYDDNGIYLCDHKNITWATLFKNKLFGIKFPHAQD